MLSIATSASWQPWVGRRSRGFLELPGRQESGSPNPMDPTNASSWHSSLFATDWRKEPCSQEIENQIMKKSLFSTLAAAVLGFLGLAASLGGDSPGQRLARIMEARSNISVYLSADGLTWEPITLRDESGVATKSRSWSFAEVERFVAAYPSGELLDAHGAVRLPPGTHYMRDAPPEEFSLEQKQLVPRAIVSFSKSPTHPADSSYYKTSIRNETSTPLQVLRFGGFVSSAPGVWQLNNVSGGFYTPSQFSDWYDCPGATIQLGQTVADPTNYGGRPVLWAYEVQAGTERFWVGGMW